MTDFLETHVQVVDGGIPTPEFKVEVIADSSGHWAGNGLRFATDEEAKTYARDLFSRWTLVREWRVVKC